MFGIMLRLSTSIMQRPWTTFGLLRPGSARSRWVRFVTVGIFPRKRGNEEARKRGERGDVERSRPIRISGIGLRRVGHIMGPAR